MLVVELALIAVSITMVLLVYRVSRERNQALADVEVYRQALRVGSRKPELPPSVDGYGALGVDPAGDWRILLVDEEGRAICAPAR